LQSSCKPCDGTSISEHNRQRSNYKQYTCFNTGGTGWCHQHRCRTVKEVGQETRSSVSPPAPPPSLYLQMLEFLQNLHTLLMRLCSHVSSPWSMHGLHCLNMWLYSQMVVPSYCRQNHLSRLCGHSALSFFIVPPPVPSHPPPSLVSTFLLCRLSRTRETLSVPRPPRQEVKRNQTQVGRVSRQGERGCCGEVRESFVRWSREGREDST
jgi:hypothetical protein